MSSKKPLFNTYFTGKLLAAVLVSLFFVLPNTSFSQNTKGDRPGISPGPIREQGRSKSKFKSSRSSGGQLRTANPRKSGLLKNLLDQKTSDAPAGERATVSPKRVKAPRTASQTGRVADEVVKPYVNLSGYKPPAREQADRRGRTASGKRLVTRQPSRSVNIYEWSGPKPRYGAPEQPREERAYSGNRTASGKKIVKREPSDQSRNLYLRSQKYVVNPSPEPKSSENLSSRPLRVKRITSSENASSENPSGGAGRSASKTFVTRPKNNVYWGKFSPQRGQVTTDMYGRPLRKKDFQTAPNETLPSDTVPGVNRVSRTATPSEKNKTAFRTATRSGLAWQGDISGKKLRSSSSDPRRSGPAELQKQPLNNGKLSGRNGQTSSDRARLASGAVALLKVGGKANLNNSAKAFGAGSAVAQIKKMDAFGITKGNMRTSARFNGGLQNQRSSARMDVNKIFGGSYTGKMKPVYGGRSSGGDLKLFGKSGEELMKNAGAEKGNRGKMYGISGGLIKGKAKVDPSAVAKAPLNKNRPRRSSSRENVKDSGRQSRASTYKLKKARSEREEPGVTSQSQVATAAFKPARSKRVIIGAVRIYGKGSAGQFEKATYKARYARLTRYSGFANVQRSTFQQGSQRRSVIGSVRFLGKDENRLVSRQGMYRLQKPKADYYRVAGTPQRPGFQIGPQTRATIGTVMVAGKRSYSSETRQRNGSIFRLNAADMSRLYTYRKTSAQSKDFGRLMTFSGPGQKSNPITIRQKELNLRRTNVEKYSYGKIVRSKEKIYFNFGAGSPLTKTKNIQKDPFEIKNRITIRKPENVSGIGKQRIEAGRNPSTLAGGFVVKVKAPSNQDRTRINNIPYKPPVVGTTSKGIAEKVTYVNPEKISSSAWNRVSMNYRAWKVDEKQLFNSEGLKGTLPQDRYVRNPASNVAALKVREPDQAFIRMGLMQANVRMKKSESPSFHPDSKFAHLKEDNAEGEKSFKTSIRLVFAKAFGRNDLQPSNVKEKMRRPRYDPREVKIWYD